MWRHTHTNISYACTPKNMLKNTQSWCEMGKACQMPKGQTDTAGHCQRGILKTVRRGRGVCARCLIVPDVIFTHMPTETQSTSTYPHTQVNRGSKFLNHSVDLYH